MLTRLYQVYDVQKGRVFRTKRTEQECLDYLNGNDLADYMSDVMLSIRPIWTNASEHSINEMLR